MWPVGVVIHSSIFDLDPGIVQTDKDVLIVALIPELAVEAFDLGILGRFSRMDEAQFDSVRVGPGVYGLADKFRSVVDDDDLRQAPCQRDALQNSHHTLTGERMVHLQRGALFAEIVDNGQDP